MWLSCALKDLTFFDNERSQIDIKLESPAIIIPYDNKTKEQIPENLDFSI